MHYSLIKSACNDFIVFQSFVKIQRAFEFINKLIVNLRTLFNLTALNNRTCLHLSARPDKLKDISYSHWNLNPIFDTAKLWRPVATRVKLWRGHIIFKLFEITVVIPIVSKSNTARAVRIPTGPNKPRFYQFKYDMTCMYYPQLHR